MEAALTAGLVVLGEIKAFAQSAKQAKKQREELGKETSSTGSMLKKLQDLVEEIGRMDDNDSSNTTVSAGPLSGKTVQSLLKLDDVNAEVQSLQEAMDNVRKQLDITNSRRAKKTSLKQFSLLLPQEKEREEIKTLLESVGSVRESASSLFVIIDIKLRAEKLRREENTRREDDERRRQEAKNQENKESEKQRQELIDWLKPFDYNSKHQTSTQLRQENTCGWLLEDKTFARWRSGSGSGSSSNFLWLFGIPGSGKTILFSRVIDDLKKLPDTIVAYHYCDFMNVDSTVPSTILRNIFVQLLRRTDANWLPEFKDLSSAKATGESPPSGLQDLIGLIQKASRFHRRTVIAIDALDECQATPDRQRLLRFLGLGQKDNISFFVTSRDEHDFRSAFRGLPSLSTGDTNTGIESDIRTFISSELNERPRLLELPEGLRDQIMRTLAEESKGLFHWVHCQIVAIEDCLTEEAIKTTLRSLPQDMNQTYERILKKILSRGPHAAEMARRILLWLVSATRPLHILELCEAIMIEPESSVLNEGYRVIDPMNILRACGSLIQSFSSSPSYNQYRSHPLENVLERHFCDELFPKQDVFQNHRRTYIRLSHYTVKEFLQTAQLEDCRLAVYHLPPTIANHDIAVLVLTYLMQDVFDHLEISLWDSDGLSYYFRYHGKVRGHLSKSKIGILFSYGCTNWESHLLHSTDSEGLYGLLRQFFEKRLGQLCHDDRVLREADLTVDVDNKFIYVLLLFAMRKGIRWLIQLLLNDSPISDQFYPSNSRSLRIMSMEKDETKAVEVLVRAGTYLNTLRRYDRVLPAAASGGYLELSWVLIQAGVDPNAVDRWGRTTLHLAASGGHLEVSTMLIQAGVDPNAVDQRGGTALHGAASRGDLEVSTMLIQASADPNAVNCGGRTALHNAASAGYLEVSTMLIQAGVDPNVVDRHGRTALHDAASGGHLEVSTMLIQAGVNPNAVTQSGRTALHGAASRGDLEVSTMLIQASVDPNAVDQSGRTALHDAASGGDLEVSTMLIQAGVNPNAVTQSGRTTLHDAASEGHLEVSTMLIQAGVDLNAIDEDGRTALHDAASEGHLEVSTMLIQAGVDPNAVDQSGRTALHDAASEGHLEVLTMLIQAGVDPNAVDQRGGTALHDATYKRHWEVSTMLIQAGANPNAVDQSGSTALHDAASRGHLEVSTMLIQAGANPNAVDQRGRTALHDAASGGDLEISTMLIQAGANPNAVDEEGRTALHHAASGGYLDLSTMLIQAGANHNAVDEKGKTALHDAASGGRLEISKVLIQASADPLSKNKSGKTPLHIAIDLHSKLIVECLLSNGAPPVGLGLLYDEQAQWAQELPWYSQLTLREFDYSAPVDEEVDVIPPRSVLEVRWILHKMLRLPSEVVSLILDLSEHWAHSFVWQKDQIVTSGYDDISYLSVKLRSKGSGSLRKVVFTTKSYKGTEYSIIPDQEPVYNRYHDSYFKVTVTPPTGRPSPESRLIQCNVSNSPVSRIHVNTWEYNDHANWMDKIHPGDLISVHAKALLEKNVVDFVRMDIYCAW